LDRFFKIIFLLLVLILVTVPLFSQKVGNTYHIISDYNIEVIGKSNPKIIKSFIEPSKGEPVFSSVEEMEKALQAKWNNLNNMRLFESITYSYEPVIYKENAIYYRVDFVIKDAFSFIAIPYPKYDSNYGFRFGLKAYDKNLFGTFSDLYFLINTTQIENSWEKLEWDTELAVKNIPIGPSSLNFSFEGSLKQHSEVFDDLSWSSLITWNNIKIEETKIDLEFSFEEISEPTDGIKAYLTGGFKWSSLPFFKSNLSVKPQLQMIQKKDNDYFDIDYASIESVLKPIILNGEEYLLSNKFFAQFPHEYLRSTSKLSLLDAKLFTLSFDFWFSADNYFSMKEQHFYDNTYAIGFSLGKSFPFNTKYESAFEISLGAGFDTPLNLRPILSTTQIISFGSINWRENFRHGGKGEISAAFDYALLDGEKFNTDYLKYVTYVDFTGFLTIKNKFQFGTRLSGFYSNIPSVFEGYDFPEFMPNGKKSAISLIRGILNNTFDEAVGSKDYQKLGAVINLDATLLFMKLGSFADAFINGFMDFGIFTTTINPTNDITNDDLIVFKTIGFEGYGIIRKFPSYPIRASIGFNLDDIIKHVKGEIGFTDIEYVLTVGMGLHY